MQLEEYKLTGGDAIQLTVDCLDRRSLLLRCLRGMVVRSNNALTEPIISIMSRANKFLRAVAPV